MKRKSKQIEIAVIITALMILCPAANAGIGLGIAPASITIEDAFKGGTYERTITIFNTGDETGIFGFTAEGECAGWISFYKEEAPDTPITEVTIPGKDKARLIVKFDIPEDIANADYTSTIYAQSVPKGEVGEGMGAQAVIRIPSEVLIQVTGTQILKGTVKSITTADTETDYPLKIKVEFKNEGNVVAKPKIAVAITKTGGGELVDSFVHDETGIKPAQEGTITVLWNTTGRDTGDYVANVAVSLGEELLATEDLPFKVLPFGSLTRRGVLQSLTIEGEPFVNRFIKVHASFENTGEIDTMAKFKGEIYLEGSLLDVMESDEMFVEVGETGKLTSYYKTLESGSYAIKGRVFYAGKETAEKEVSFDVPVPEVEEESPGPAEEEKKGIPGFEAVFALAALILVLFLFKVRKRRKFV